MVKLSIIITVLTGILTKGKYSQVFGSEVTYEDQKIIINKHNALRRSLEMGEITGQPKACSMKTLKYDAQLAKEAQKIADTCKFEHVPVNDPRWRWVGQNLHQAMSTVPWNGSSWDEIIQAWFDEHKEYHYPDDPSSSTGHYTQVAWADTEFVGCGFTSFESDGMFKYRKLYVCNYGPGGNIKGQAPYKVATNGKCPGEGFYLNATALGGYNIAYWL